ARHARAARPRRPRAAARLPRTRRRRRWRRAAGTGPHRAGAAPARPRRGRPALRLHDRGRSGPRREPRRRRGVRADRPAAPRAERAAPEPGRRRAAGRRGDRRGARRGGGRRVAAALRGAPARAAAHARRAVHRPRRDVRPPRRGHGPARAGARSAASARSRPMTFLAPAAAWMFALLAPLVLLYMLRLRRPPRRVPSLLLWRQTLQDERVNAPLRRLRRDASLLLQIALLALLALAATQPLFGSKAVGASVVVLLDRSASMAARDAQGRSRLDLAKARAAELFAAHGGAELALVSFAAGAE